MKKLIFAALLPLLLAACEKSLGGTYVDPATGVSVTFNDDYLQVIDSPLLKYERDGDNVVVDTPTGKVVYFTIKDDKHIVFVPEGVLLKKK